MNPTRIRSHPVSYRLPLSFEHHTNPPPSDTRLEKETKNPTNPILQTPSTTVISKHLRATYLPVTTTTPPKAPPSPNIRTHQPKPPDLIPKDTSAHPPKPSPSSIPPRPHQRPSSLHAINKSARHHSRTRAPSAPQKDYSTHRRRGTAQSHKRRVVTSCAETLR